MLVLLGGVGWLRRAGGPRCVPMAAGHFVVRSVEEAHGSIAMPLGCPAATPAALHSPAAASQAAKLLLLGNGNRSGGKKSSVAEHSITHPDQDSWFHRTAGPVLKLCCCLCHVGPPTTSVTAGLLLCYGTAVLCGAQPPCPCSAAGAWPGSSAAPIADNGHCTAQPALCEPLSCALLQKKYGNGVLGGVLALFCGWFSFNCFLNCCLSPRDQGGQI